MDFGERDTVYEAEEITFETGASGFETGASEFEMSATGEHHTPFEEGETGEHYAPYEGAETGEHHALHGLGASGEENLFGLGGTAQHEALFEGIGTGAPGALSHHDLGAEGDGGATAQASSLWQAHCAADHPEWSGPPRADREDAQDDADEHNGNEHDGHPLATVRAAHLVADG